MLPKWVRKGTVDHPKHGQIAAAEIKPSVTPCPDCGHRKTALYGSRRKLITDVEAGKPVRISLLQKRLRCCKCRKVFQEAIPGVTSSCSRETERFAEWLRSLDMTAREIAELTGLHEWTVYSKRH